MIPLRVTTKHLTARSLVEVRWWWPVRFDVGTRSLVQMSARVAVLSMDYAAPPVGMDTTEADARMAAEDMS